MFSSTAKRASRSVAFRAIVIWTVGFAFLLFGIAVGCDGPSPPTNPDATAAQPIFWQIDAPEVTGQASAGRLYLLGSIHVGPEGGWQLPAAILERFEASNALIVEIDMRDREALESQDDLVLAHGLLPPGQSIKNHISESTYEMLERHAENRGPSLANLNPWQAWMIATMLLTNELERLGYPTEAGVDLDLMARASEEQTIIGLETMEQQLKLLSSMSKANQELMLKDMLLQVEDIETYFGELKEAWRTGNEAKLEDVLFQELKRTPELAPFYQRVIYDRNESMCEGFREQLESGETRFGVVGVYHVIGERGVPACLKRLGYQVIRLRDAAAQS